MVGHAFMGRAHSQAWHTVGRAFDLPLRPVTAAIAGRNEAALAEAADRLGWESTETDWRRLVERDDIDLVDICSPGDTHVEIALAALAAGKHVLCEKPLANTVADAERMTVAAEAARAQGVRSMVGYSYRRTPALALARQLVADGRIGDIRHVRAAYLQDWISDPEFPLVWRLQKDLAGSGALGDIGSHIVDLAQFLTGQHITGVSALTETFVKERPLPSASAGLSATGGTERGDVTVDDAALFLARLDGGAVATFEATRFALGRKNAMRIEINGSRGSLAFDFESMNELQFFDGTGPAEDAGFRRILATEPDHPYLSGWWPPGHGLGYEHTFTHQAKDMVEAIAAGTDPAPSFADGLRVQRVLDAVERSAAASSTWTPIACTAAEGD
ncbi:Gfo/Idh/MocA family protein [Pseudonocardia nigra]|uniref:Gfo/Idh/MocA family protein n=1 Tax=Pseudonocardia nigra TaxID=1921578 RepID=UPI001C5F8517|nr:Gfo/Idh/MocA family oxidoreductase [Pseudonocardia nigra]